MVVVAADGEVIRRKLEVLSSVSRCGGAAATGRSAFIHVKAVLG